MISALPLGLDSNAVSDEESLQAPPRQQLACGAIDVAMMMHLSGPLLKRSANALMGWQLRWFEVGGGSVRYYSSPDEAKAHAKPAGKVSLAGLCVQRKSNSAFDFTVLQTGDRIFSLDADVGSEVGSAGWQLEPGGVPTALQWVAALQHGAEEAIAEAKEEAERQARMAEEAKAKETAEQQAKITKKAEAKKKAQRRAKMAVDAKVKEEVETQAKIAEQASQQSPEVKRWQTF